MGPPVWAEASCLGGGPPFWAGGRPSVWLGPPAWIDIQAGGLLSRPAIRAGGPVWLGPPALIADPLWAGDLSRLGEGPPVWAGASRLGWSLPSETWPSVWAGASGLGWGLRSGLGHPVWGGAFRRLLGGPHVGTRGLPSCLGASCLSRGPPVWAERRAVWTGASRLGWCLPSGRRTSCRD